MSKDGDDGVGHGGDCHCPECEARKEGLEDGRTSAEMAGGVAVGLNGHIHGFNADAEARLDAALMDVGRWIESEAGYFLGHVKMAVYNDGGGITLNLIDLKIGVEHHGRLEPCERADFHFMSAVLDVDPGELKHRMHHALEDTGVDMCLEEHECHCHDHGHEHNHDHDHDHVEEGATARDVEKKDSFWSKLRRKKQ